MKKCSVAKSNQISELIVDWIANDLRPLSIVNDDGFRNLVKFLEPSFSIPSRKTIAKMVQSALGSRYIPSQMICA